MIRKLFLILFITLFASGYGMAQSFIKTSDIISKSDNRSSPGQLNIIQDPAIDTLISRYILYNKKLSDEHDYFGMDGFRIQIYSSSRRDARDESSKVRAEFISKFPGIVSYKLFDEPAFYKIRVGDFRTRTEATKLFLIIRMAFPDAYIVPDFIHFPDLNIK